MRQLPQLQSPDGLFGNLASLCVSYRLTYNVQGFDGAMERKAGLFPTGAYSQLAQSPSVRLGRLALLALGLHCQ